MPAARITLGVGDGSCQLGGVQAPGYSQRGGQAERGDRQAVDSLDLADVLDVIHGGAGLDQECAGRFLSSLAQVVKQVDTPPGAGDKRSPAPSPPGAGTW